MALQKGIIVSICVSSAKGTAKRPVEKAEFVAKHGIAGDAHAGAWHRQVSLLSADAVDDFRRRGADVANGAFGENLLVRGINLNALRVGAVLKTGGAVLRVTQIGKECHAHCAIYDQVGDCIMPREGIFAEVLQGGQIQAGDKIYVEG